MRVRVQQDFWEYEANGKSTRADLGQLYLYCQRLSYSAYKSVAMEIVPGKVVSEIRQYFYR